MIFADTHCHLYLKQFNKDIEQVYSRAVESGVTHIFLPAIDWKSFKAMDRLSHPKISFYKMAGIHPCSVEDVWPFGEEKLVELCERDDVVGVGETGLDYYWSTDFTRQQKTSLRMHCSVARSTGKPIVLHNRESTADLLDIIEEEQDGRLTGVWHCFTGSEDEGKRALDLGLHLGIGGVSTFKNAGVGEVVARMPLDKLILETDAPYLAPAPFRGRRNEPAYIKNIAEHLSELKETPLEEIARVTTDNAFRLFKVKHYSDQ